MTEPIMGNIRAARSRRRMDAKRRSLTFGLAASLFSAAVPAPADAQEPDVPNFRSNDFQFALIKPRQALPSVRLFPLRGKAIYLASLRGKPILLNFWATWCAACRTEMPMLDRLSREYRGSGLQVIAVSTDKTGRTVVEPFVDKLSIQSLPLYLDPNGYVVFSDPDNMRKAPFALYGMPITYAVTASGWVVGYISGAADWDSSEARQLIEFLRRA